MSGAILRVMDADGSLPKIGRSRVQLGVVVGSYGVVPTREIDITPDANGDVHPASGGMSVSPTFATLPYWRVPKRLKSKITGATGRDHHKIWRLGDHGFARIDLPSGLILRPDGEEHGMIEPRAKVHLADYEAALGATQSSWKVEEP